MSDEHCYVCKHHGDEHNPNTSECEVKDCSCFYFEPNDSGE